MTPVSNASTPIIPVAHDALPAGAARQAVRLSFIQSMLGAVYGASTGGMFLIGYALLLGATNVQIGLMSTIPMLCIGVQLLTAALVERGVSRRMLTFVASLLNVAAWVVIILIPYAAAGAPASTKAGLLIAVITAVTFFAYVAGNARGSWVGDLIPARFRGTFFGKAAMYSGIVASLFAIGEGAMLDVLKSHGLPAFSGLFGFGILFGAAGALLFLPQKDVPVRRHEDGANVLRLVREVFANRELMPVMLFATVWSLQAVAGPFYLTYMLRDLGVPFVGVGIINACSTLAAIVSGPIWGRIVDRWGCRPVLQSCTSVLGLLPFAWYWVDSPGAAYRIIPGVNLIAGACMSGVGVALGVLIYKATPSVGRSIHFATYSIVVTLAAAPLPWIGGHLPEWLTRLHLPSDVRFTFYLAGGFVLLSSLATKRIHEPGARRTRVMLRELGSQWLGPLVKWIG
jgi:hypothetical protein